MEKTKVHSKSELRRLAIQTERSEDDFELEPTKACKIDNPDCEACQ